MNLKSWCKDRRLFKGFQSCLYIYVYVYIYIYIYKCIYKCILTWARLVDVDSQAVLQWPDRDVAERLVLVVRDDDPHLVQAAHQLVEAQLRRQVDLRLDHLARLRLAVRSLNFRVWKHFSQNYSLKRNHYGCRAKNPQFKMPWGSRRGKRVTTYISDVQ